jgi:hypothetical protein
MTDDEINGTLPRHIPTGPVTIGGFREPCAVCGDGLTGVRHDRLAFHDRCRQIWLEEVKRRG